MPSLHTIRSPPTAQSVMHQASQGCGQDSLRMSGFSLAESRSVRRCSFFLKCSSSSEDSACRMLQDALWYQSAIALINTQFLCTIEH